MRTLGEPQVLAALTAQIFLSVWVTGGGRCHEAELKPESQS